MMDAHRNRRVRDETSRVEITKYEVRVYDECNESIRVIVGRQYFAIRFQSISVCLVCFELYQAAELHAFYIFFERNK